MKIRKYEHACFSAELNKKLLIVDPGGFTTDFDITNNITAVVITHKHADHLDKKILQAIYDKNLDVKIFAHPEVTEQLSDLPTVSVIENEGIKAGDFELEFYGGNHATIYPEIPPVANLGVMINKQIYYPGDSFYVPKREVHVLALPVAAPWLKIREAIDFTRTVNPDIIFPTHDAILSETGRNLIDTLVPSLLPENSRYVRIQDYLEI